MEGCDGLLLPYLGEKSKWISLSFSTVMCPPPTTALRCPELPFLVLRTKELPGSLNGVTPVKDELNVNWRKSQDTGE